MPRLQLPRFRREVPLRAPSDGVQGDDGPAWAAVKRRRVRVNRLEMPARLLGYKELRLHKHSEKTSKANSSTSTERSNMVLSLSLFLSLTRELWRKEGPWECLVRPMARGNTEPEFSRKYHWGRPALLKALLIVLIKGCPPGIPSHIFSFLGKDARMKLYSKTLHCFALTKPGRF